MLDLELLDVLGVPDGLFDVPEPVGPLRAHAPGQPLEVAVHGGDDPGLALVGLDPVEGPDQPVHRRHHQGPGAVAGLALGGQLEPDRHLLGHLDPVAHLPVRDRAAPALVEQPAHVPEELGPVLHEPAGAVEAPGLLVGGTHEDHVPVRRESRAVQRQEGLEVGDAEPLGVQGAPAPDVAVPDHARERIDLPELLVRGDHVHVMQEDERRLVTALDRGPDVAPALRRGDRVPGDARLVEDPGEVLDAPDLVARRIHRVDAQVLLGPLDGLVPEPVQVDVLGGGPGGSDQEQGNEEKVAEPADGRRRRGGSGCRERDLGTGASVGHGVIREGVFACVKQSSGPAARGRKSRAPGGPTSATPAGSSPRPPRPGRAGAARRPG